jgi:predicted phage tail protein
MMLVLLYGHLGRRFGRVHRYDARSPAEAVRALCATLPGFRRALVEGGAYRVLRGGREALAAEQIREPHSTRESLRIVPVVAGAGKGLGQILLGAALIGLSFVPGIQAIGFSVGPFSFGLSSVFRSIGMNLLFGGISQALTSTPKQQSVEAPSNKPSYAFDGAVNTAAQGNPVPVCYGRLIVGSQVVSAGLTVEQIA